MKDRVEILDTIKGVCIIFIIVTHWEWEAEERLCGLFPLWIDMAVPIFMIISGYVYAFSFKRNQVNELKEAYRLPFVYKKALRYVIPFTIAYLIEILIKILKYALLGSPLSITEAIITYIDGGVGPGSYYFPIMMQFIFVFPLIYFLIKDNPKRGLCLCFLFNLLYEVLQRAYALNDGTYRLLLFRYIFLIGAGCFLYLYPGRLKRRWLIASFLVGLSYILLVSYTDYEPKIIIYWTGTSFMAALYIIPIFYLLIEKWGQKGCKALAALGRASFNIFLAQMVYYCDASQYIRELAASRAASLCINLVVCITAGMLFYMIESKITRYLAEHTKSLVVHLEARLERLWD